jgi:hypothetical protein
MKNQIETIETVTVPAGKYWLADPCYVIRDNQDWWKVCDSFSDDKKNTSVKLDNGCHVFAFNVSNDGTYYDQENTEYFVDSGTIGLVSVEYNPDYSTTRGNGRMVEFKEETVCFLEDNYLKFGEIIIDLENDDDYSYDN